MPYARQTPLRCADAMCRTRTHAAVIDSPHPLLAYSFSFVACFLTSFLFSLFLFSLLRPPFSPSNSPRTDSPLGHSASTQTKKKKRTRTSKHKQKEENKMRVRIVWRLGRENGCWSCWNTEKGFWTMPVQKSWRFFSTHCPLLSLSFSSRFSLFPCLFVCCCVVVSE